MNPPGADSRDLLARSRSALLDAVEALDAHRDAVIVIGAQAIYLRTKGASVALAEATKDTDFALDPRRLNDDPLVADAMTRAGFYRDFQAGQPGAWRSRDGIPVDLMVPEALAGPGSRTTRGARISPHDRRAARRARGLEASVVDNTFIDVAALDPADQRRYRVRVAGPAALLVAKLHKIAERVHDPRRLLDKDAHDVYRILIEVDTSDLAAVLESLRADPIAGETTNEAIHHLDNLFAAGPHALGARMAGRAEEGIGEPETVTQSVTFLAADLVRTLKPGR